MKVVKVEKKQVGDQIVPMVTLEDRTKRILLEKVEGGVTEDTLRKLFVAGTNPLWEAAVKPDGTLNLNAVQRTLSARVDSGPIQDADKFRKTAAKAGAIFRCTIQTKVCPKCGALLGRNGVAHLIQAHTAEGEGLVGLALRWKYDGYIDAEMYADTESLMPIWKAAGATAEAKKKARGTSGKGKDRSKAADDDLSSIEIEW